MLLRLFLWGFLFFIYTAGISPLHCWSDSSIGGLETEFFYVTADDGVEIPLYHVVQPHHETKPILLLEPGLGARSHYFSPVLKALAIHFDLYLGNWRGSHGIRQPSGGYGLSDILEKDVKAQIDFILPRLSQFQRDYGISLLGHSMGGMMIMSFLTRYGTLYRHVIRAALPIQSPSHFSYLPKRLRLLARLGRPILRALMDQGVLALDIQGRLPNWTLHQKRHGHPLSRAMALSLETIALELFRIAMGAPQEAHMNLPQICFQAGARFIPLALLQEISEIISFHQGYLRTGVIDPQKIPHDLPILSVLAQEDTLAPPQEQQEYRDKIREGSRPHVFVDLHDMGHIDPMTTTRPYDLIRLIREFIEDPHEMAGHASLREFKTHKPCDDYLRDIDLSL